MKGSIISIAGFIALSAAQLVQRPDQQYPRVALETATDKVNAVTAYFNNRANITNFDDGRAFSNDVVTQLKTITDYFNSTLYKTINPQYYQPNSPPPKTAPLLSAGMKRKRTCAERKAIVTAYKNLFVALDTADKAVQAAACRGEALPPPGFMLQDGYRANSVNDAAGAQLQKMQDDVQRLWDTLANKYPAFYFYVFGCKQRLNPASCDQEEGGPVASSTCCVWKYVDGVNPNAQFGYGSDDKNCQIPEADFEAVVDFADGVGPQASFGWVNIKDCRECDPNANPLPKCAAVPDCKVTTTG
ncbi:hypothetical protein TWF694_001950 [Orbilia ellipsospora]|uniref:Secreted protein n=1 Tax=Orbilia ellipsospora TaxID=2528407 RepID=A0AAV9XAB1_9PEZI